MTSVQEWNGARHWSLGRMRGSLRLAQGDPLQVEEENEEQEVDENNTRRSAIRAYAMLHDLVVRRSFGQSVDRIGQLLSRSTTKLSQAFSMMAVSSDPGSRESPQRPRGGTNKDSMVVEAGLGAV